MILEPLRNDKKFSSWTIFRVADTLCDEWSALNPIPEKNVIVHDKKAY